MPTATNPETGEKFYLDDGGQWKTAPTATNPETGEKFVFDGSSWTPEAPKDYSLLDKTSDLVIAAAQGASAGWGDEMAGVTAGVGRVINPLRWLTEDGSIGERFNRGYDETTKGIRGNVERGRRQMPIASTVAEIGGAVALPSAALAKGLSLPARMARGAVEGAGYGAAYGAGSADGGDRGEGALWGGGTGLVAGGLAPAAIEGASRLGSSAMRALRGPGAAQRVGNTIAREQAKGRAGLTNAEFAAAQADNMPVMNIDRGGEGTRALARSAANNSPEARQILQNSLDDRFTAQGDRFDDLFSGADAFSTREGLKDAARKANAPLYRAAASEAERKFPQGIYTQNLERLSSADMVQKAMRDAQGSVRNRAVMGGSGLMNSGLRPTPGGALKGGRVKPGQGVPHDLGFWDATKKRLDAYAEMAARQGDNDTASQARDLARQLRDELDVNIPSYAKARGMAAQFFGADDALEAGEKLFAAKMEPSEIAAKMAKLNNAEKDLLREGFKAALRRELSKTGDNRDLLLKFNNRAMRDKMRAVFGKDAVQIEARLYVEKVMDMTRGAVGGNSTTARQLVELGMAGGGTTAGYTLISGDTDPYNMIMAALVGAGGRRGLRALMTGHNQRLAEQIAKLLVSDDPKLIDRAIKLAASSEVMMEAFRQAATVPAARAAALVAN